LMFEKNHKSPFAGLLFFKTDDGRTHAGADASRINIGDFIAFFSNRCPSRCRCCSLHRCGRQRAARESALKNSAKAKTVNSGEEGEGATLARFLISLPTSARCRTGERQWLGDGGRKKGDDQHPKFLPPAGSCFYPARSRRKISTDGNPRLFPAVGTFRRLRPINSQSDETLLVERSDGRGERSGGGAGRAGSWGKPVFRLATGERGAGRKSGLGGGWL
jgi:hypothetical protein